MAHRSIEEVFQSIAPSRRRGIPNPPESSVGFTASGGDVGSSMSQVANEIAQLRASYQQQQDLITANTQAVQNNTSAKSGGSSVAGTVGHVASGLFGGALGVLSPVVSGIMNLFGSGTPAPAPLPLYTPPPPVGIDGIVRESATPAASSSPQSTPAPASASQTNYSPQITVQVSAMDSQSFMDRSDDIASAVRVAMLNNHPINGVVTDL